MQCSITNDGRNRENSLAWRGVVRCLLIVASVLPSSLLPWTAAVVPAIAWPVVAIAQDEAGDAPADEASEPEGENMLVFYYKALGLRYVIVFLALSFGLVALLVMCFMQIRRAVLMPPGLSKASSAAVGCRPMVAMQALSASEGIWPCSRSGPPACAWGLLCSCSSPPSTRQDVCSPTGSRVRWA